MATSTLLEQAEEDKLHATRLLTVEDKPFKRLTKRLLATNSPIQSFYSRLPTPPIDEGRKDEAESDDITQQKALGDLARFREDVLLDFAAFESSIARIQFLRASNKKERERYAAEKEKIEATAQAVRDNTAQLRIQLDEAQKMLAIRKTYDVLAEAITSDKALKPRDEQVVNIEKLKAEIEDLERESRDHSQAWSERREAFGKVVNEGMRLRRLVRDEKEPEAPDGNAEEMLDAIDSREPLSNIGTPRPDLGGLTPMPVAQDSGGLTPRSVLQDRSGVDIVNGGVEEKKGEQELDDTHMTDEGHVGESRGDSQADPDREADIPIDKSGDQMDTS